jgi:hypothetical protein
MPPNTGPWELVCCISFQSRERVAEWEKYLTVGSGHAFAHRHLWIMASTMYMTDVRHGSNRMGGDGTCEPPRRSDSIQRGLSAGQLPQDGTE